MDIKLQVGVKAFLQNKDGKYLLLKRSCKKYPTNAGLWDIIGGRIDAGVSLFENLKREVFEESQLHLTEEPKLIDAVDILRVPGLHVVRLTYLGRIDGEPIVDTEEIEEFKWLTIEEIKNLDDLDMYTKQLLEKGILRE
ncbi:NUDIX hydrolase [Candidatus Woesebacteria bacterium]|jgi:8-oxo-dGTP diphosphatase|nr:NUDIX hydrolase [Candidatus Woesebacteria bacterium]